MLPPLVPALPPPEPDAWFVEASVVGGASLGPVSGPLGEVLAFGVWRPPMERARASVLAMSDVRALGGEAPALSDLHALQARLGQRGGPLSVAGSLTGSLASDPWSELGVGAQLASSRLSAPLYTSVELALLGRQDAQLSAVGLLASARGELRVGPRAQLSAHVERRAFGAQAPSLTTMGLGARLSPHPVLGLRAGLSLWTSLGEPDVVWADQVAPGEALVTTKVVGELRLPGGWSAPLELALTSDLVGDEPLSGALRAGVTWSRTPRRESGGPRPVRLCLDAPQARLVTLSGSFNGWSAEPLVEEGGGRWCATVTLYPGVHTYVYAVDGVIVTPTDAQLVREDAFGVREGVLVVGD